MRGLAHWSVSMKSRRIEGIKQHPYKQKTDGFGRNQSASRVFPVDDSAFAEPPLVCLANSALFAIRINDELLS